MAVIIDDDSAAIHIETLAKDLKKHGLPPYARPCFIRLTKNIELTGKKCSLHCSSLNAVRFLQERSK